MFRVTTLRLQDRILRLSENRRLVLLILALLAARLVLYGWLAGGAPALPAALCRWDCSWYRDVARSGYSTHPKTILDPTFAQAAWAFFPVFPMLMRGAQQLFGGSFEAAGMAVSNLFLCGFVFVSVKYMKLVRPAASGAALAVFLFAFPYSFYLSIPYTEAVYAALAMAAFWCLAGGRLLGASVAAALLSATRVTGVLLTPVIVVRAGRVVWRAWRRGDVAAAQAGLMAAILPVALAPLGLFGFMLYLYMHTGDGLAFLHIQRAWGRAGQNPFAALWLGLGTPDLLGFRPFTHQSDNFNALGGLAGLLIAARLLLLRRYAESWFLATAIIIPLTHGLDSLPRYSLAQPIFMVFLFEAIWSCWLRSAFWEIVAACAVVQLILAQLWMQGYAFIH